MFNSVACGTRFSVFIDFEGNPWVCGFNTTGALGTTSALIPEPRQLDRPY